MKSLRKIKMEKEIAKMDHRIVWLTVSIPLAIGSFAIGNVWSLATIPFYILGILWYQRKIKKVRRSK